MDRGYIPSHGARTAGCVASGDLALRSAARQLKRLRKLPTDTRLEGIAAGWRPWRSVAARILWHHYLSERRKSSVPAAR